MQGRGSATFTLRLKEAGRGERTDASGCAAPVLPARPSPTCAPRPWTCEVKVLTTRLSSPTQAATANQEQAWIARVYRGEQAKLGVADLAQLQAAAGNLNVSFDEFQHLSALVRVVGRERGRHPHLWKGRRLFF